MPKSMLTHTPAPWLIGPNDRRDGLSVVAKKPRDHAVAVCYGTDRLDNAHLIAAAPDMLKALAAAVAALEIAFDHEGDAFGIHHNDAVDALFLARAAIAKTKPV